MRKQSYISPKTEIRSSSTQDKGLFVLAVIDTDEVVVKFAGTYVSAAEADQVIQQGNRSPYLHFQVATLTRFGTEMLQSNFALQNFQMLGSKILHCHEKLSP
jgi:hypothetical protein